MIPHTARAGLVVGAAGVLILSPDALLLRLFGGDNYALASGRAFALAAYIGLLAVCFRPLRANSNWRRAACYGVFYALGLISFPMSVRHTHVANTVVILAIAPLLSAIGARWFLGECIAARTWIACAVAAVGLAFIFASQLSADGLVGDLWALLTAFALAACAITIRRYPQTNLFLGMAFGGLLCGMLYAPFADWNLSTDDIALLGLNGAVLAVAFLCIMVASRRLSPPEINLLFLLETATAPLWVWLVLDEEPPWVTATAGLLIVAVLVWHSWAAWRGLPTRPPR